MVDVPLEAKAWEAARLFGSQYRNERTGIHSVGVAQQGTTFCIVAHTNKITLSQALVPKRFKDFDVSVRRGGVPNPVTR